MRFVYFGKLKISGRLTGLIMGLILTQCSPYSPSKETSKNSNIALVPELSTIAAAVFETEAPATAPAPAQTSTEAPGPAPVQTSTEALAPTPVQTSTETPAPAPTPVQTSTEAPAPAPTTYTVKTPTVSAQAGIASEKGPDNFGATPGSYANQKWPTIDRTSEDYFITVNVDPGPTSNVFWSNQFSVGTFGGYTGLQTTYLRSTTGNSAGDMFLFSVWGATKSKLGSEGSWCIGDTDGVGGQSCRMLHSWIVGHTYRFRLSIDSEGWLTSTVLDLDSSTTFIIGHIFLNSSIKTVNPGLEDQWTEYFEWNNGRTSCGTVPFSSVTFSASSTTGNSVIYPSISETHTSKTCKSYTTISTNSENKSKSTQINGVGNSVRTQIHNNGLCLNAAGGLSEGATMILYPCGTPPTIGKNEAWVYANDGSIRSDSNYCVTASNTQNGIVTLQECVPGGAINQEWSVTAGQITSNLGDDLYLTVNLEKKIVISKIPAKNSWTVPSRLYAP